MLRRALQSPAIASLSRSERRARAACALRFAQPQAGFSTPVVPSTPLRQTAVRDSSLLQDASASIIRTPVRSSSYAVKMAVNAVHNGLMQNDDIFQYGLPEAKFQFADLFRGTTLEQIFEEHASVDPFQPIQDDLQSVSDTLRSVIGSDHPVLRVVAQYFFDVNGKRVRPAIVMLMSRAMSLSQSIYDSQDAVPLSASTSPSTNGSATISFSSSPLLRPSTRNDAIRPSQQRLSEICELIHTASLLHDDVIDEAATRRNAPSVNATFGNKLAILGGDFLLARASLSLAKLRNPDVIELMSSVIEHLVKGEVMQIKEAKGSLLSQIDYYLAKSYYKTASLIANSCRSVAILGGHDERIQDIAYEYGKNAGLAFQIVDDILDFVGNSDKTGKPTHNDLHQGLATAPVLIAAAQYPEITPMIARKFSQEGDVARTLELVEQSGSIRKAQDLARTCAANAVAAVLQLPPSLPRSALIALVQKVLTRER